MPERAGWVLPYVCSHTISQKKTKLHGGVTRPSRSFLRASELNVPKQHPPQGANEEPDGQINDAHDEANLPPLGLRDISGSEHDRSGTNRVLCQAAVDVAQTPERNRSDERRYSSRNHTLPSAGLGALLALQVTYTPLTVIAFVGIILLIGIVKKNGIMMVDFALDAERNRGLSSADAILEACRARFRPILMTTMTALFAGIPLVIATGPGTELRRPLGITIIGGLFVSQILALYTTPVIYLLIDRLRRRREQGRALNIISAKQ